MADTEGGVKMSSGLDEDGCVAAARTALLSRLHVRTKTHDCVRFPALSRAHSDADTLYKCIAASCLLYAEAVGSLIWAAASHSQ